MPLAGPVPASPYPDPVEAIRAFNRMYTRSLGLLNHGLLGSRFSLTEARVLYELAQQDGATATDLSRTLGIDMGYLSRLLANFSRSRLIKRTRSAGDARSSSVRLTPDGHAAFESLDRAARDQIVSLIQPMTVVRREELLTAMRSMRRILEPYERENSYFLRPVRLDDLRPIIERQGALYGREYGWDESYRTLVADILGNFVKTFEPKHEAGWIAERHGKMAGSVFVMRASASVAQLRLLYVEPKARGLGIGGRLVRECIGFARAGGYGTLTLWTNDVLVAARRIYEDAGFQLTKQEDHRRFGKHLVGQWWELEL